MAITSVEATPVVVAVGDSHPRPVVKLLEGGAPTDTGKVSSVTLRLVDHEVDADGVTINDVTVDLTGALTDLSTYEFTYNGTTDVHEANHWKSVIKIAMVSGDTYTFAGPRVTVVDYNALWASPSDVAEIAPDHTEAEYVRAILLAEDAVKAWVSSSISSPVSERVSRAVALLAARAFSPSSATVVSESIGDHTVRYDASGMASGLTIDGEIEALLAPYTTTVYSTYTGPVDPDLSATGTVEV